MRLKLTKTGDALSTTWPREVLSRLKVKEGDELQLIEIPQGVMVMPFDPKFERTMQAAEAIMDRDEDALKELAKR